MKQLKISESITNRESRSFKQYLTEVNRYDLLTAEQEVDLAVRIRAGDAVALNKLVKSNLRFVISVAKQYQRHGLVIEDLVNEGNLGLLTAARRFDETRGFKFISYAVWWIRQSIVTAISLQARIVRLPVNQIGDLIKAKRAQSNLEQHLQREPTIEELAEAMDMSKEKLSRALSNAERQLSTDAPSLHAPDTTLLDSLPFTGIPTDQQAMKDSLTTMVGSAVLLLPEREQKVLNLFFGLGGIEPRTLSEIASELNLTTERIRQIKSNALRLLQQSREGLL